MTKNKTQIAKCECCKTNDVGKSGVMCENCWDWLTKKMTIGDIGVVIANIYHREPLNKHAKEICQYLVADNYMRGEATLVKQKYKKSDKKFPSITKNNLDTWNDITYGYIIAGMIIKNPEIPYGEQMTRANNLTNLLFMALRKDMGVKTPPIHKEF